MNVHVVQTEDEAEDVFLIRDLLRDGEAGQVVVLHRRRFGLMRYGATLWARGLGGQPVKCAVGSGLTSKGAMRGMWKSLDA